LKSVTLAGIDAEIISATDDAVIVRAGIDGISGQTGDVVIQTATDVTLTLEDAFEYLPASMIYNVEPAVGHFGTQVVITGVSLLGGAEIVSVTLAGEEASVQSSSDEEIKITATNSELGKVGQVIITSSEGVTVARLDGWTYVAQATITGVSPGSGQEGTRATIEGTNL